MFATFKFFICFCVSFVLLSIPVQRKPLFFYLNEWASPITSEIFSSSRDVILDSIQKSKKVGTKLFNNTKPGNEDVISTQSSAVEQLNKEVEHDFDHGETYTEEEKHMLKEILINGN